MQCWPVDARGDGIKKACAGNSPAAQQASTHPPLNRTSLQCTAEGTQQHSYPAASASCDAPAALAACSSTSSGYEGGGEGGGGYSEVHIQLRLPHPAPPRPAGGRYGGVAEMEALIEALQAQLAVSERQRQAALDAYARRVRCGEGCGRWQRCNGAAPAALPGLATLQPPHPSLHHAIDHHHPLHRRRASAPTCAPWCVRSASREPRPAARPPAWRSATQSCSRSITGAQRSRDPAWPCIQRCASSACGEARPAAAHSLARGAAASRALASTP